MVAYSFDKRFIQPILSGIKCQTIRGDRKRHAHPGEAMQLYYAMRTKHCRMIQRVTCESVMPVTLDFPDNSVTIGGERLTGWDRLEPFAMRDGFDGWLAMREFWREHHPGVSVFSGVLIRWTEFSPS